jgi:hypothetical protein
MLNGKWKKCFERRSRGSQQDDVLAAAYVSHVERGLARFAGREMLNGKWETRPPPSGAPAS